MRIIALYPVQKIQNQIKREFSKFIFATILAILLLSAIVAIFLHGFITPVNALEKAAIALKNKTFSYRLPKLGNDELGEMAEIFNKNLEDMEELSAAGIVQNQIMPLTPIQNQKISLFGKSIVLTELGGDYFDYFEITENDKTTYSMMMGDVAGHGVGAALLMTMAKTTVNFFSNYLRQPVKLINELHKLILSTKTRKQRKIMTFQLLSFDPNTLKGIYANAGACSPFLVKKNGVSVTEIFLPGLVLGAFKKSKFQETEIDFEHGDALIFYTDGIAEAKNIDNEVLGYDRLKQMVKKSWQDDAELYYQQILNEYHNWLNGAKAVDDLTIMVFIVK